MITQRQNAILNLIVEMFTRTHEPVCSKALQDSIDSSSATIRNDMAKLEKMGYLEKAHISSGRMPSRAGFQYFVANSLNLDTIDEQDVYLLAEMTGCTAVIQDVEPTKQRLTGFEIVQLSNHDALAVLTLDESKPVTVQFAIPKNFLSSDLEIFHKLVQGRFLGNTVLDIHYRLRTETPQIVQKYFKITDNVLDLFDYIFSHLFKELIFIEGKVASLAYADLKTYQFLDNPQHVALALRSAISDDEVTKISVAESTEEALENVTVMSHKFLIPYRGTALMHVIGPIEMDYRRMVSLVNVISRVLVMKLTDYYRYLNSNHYEVFLSRNVLKNIERGECLD